MCAFVQISVSKLWLCVHNACAHICESTVVTLRKYLWANCKCKETRLTMLLSEDSWVSGSRLRCRSSNFGTFQVQKQYSMILFNNELLLEGFFSLLLSQISSTVQWELPTIRNVLFACTRFFLANCEEQFLCLKAKARQHSSNGNSRRRSLLLHLPWQIFSPILFKERGMECNYHPNAM